MYTPQEVIGMFTSRDLLGELARYPDKSDAFKVKAQEFMIPLSRMIYCSPKDSLYQCLLVMSELKVKRSCRLSWHYSRPCLMYPLLGTEVQNCVMKVRYLLLCFLMYCR